MKKSDTKTNLLYKLTTLNLMMSSLALIKKKMH